MSSAPTPHPLTWKPPPRGEDLPYCDGEPMESLRHASQMNLLIRSLRLAWRDRHDFFVAGNMFVYFSETQAKKNDFRGPDVFVVLDTTKKERKSWVVWEEEGKMPDVVIELLSPSTEQVDRGEKKRLYAKVLKVSQYYLFDPFTGQLEGYQLDPASLEYVAIEPDEHGRLPCRSLGLSLGLVPGTYDDIQADWLRWFDAQGNILPHEDERVTTAEQRAAAEAQRAAAEAQRAERAEAELARLRAELERLKGA